MRIFFMALVLLCTGCSPRVAMFVPVEGPLSINPMRLNAEFTANGTGHGEISIVMPDGEVCTGNYSTIAEGVSGSVSGALFSRSHYARHYGSYSVMESKQYGQGMLVGTNGTVIHIEYYTSPGSHGYGLGKDNRGNVYKIIF